MADETQIDNFQIEDEVVTNIKVAADANISQTKIHNLQQDLSLKLNKAGDTMTGPLILNADPVDPSHAASKQYIDLRTNNLSSQLDAIVSIYGLKIYWAGSKILDISAGAIKIFGILYHFTSDLNIDFNTTGSGGLDTGSILANKFYYIHALVNSSTNMFGVIASASSSSPLLPGGFNSSKLIGAVKTDGSGNLLKFKTLGNQSYRKLFWEDMIETPAPSGSGTWKTILLSNYVPLGLTKCIALDMRFLVGAGVTDQTFIRKGGTTSTNGSFTYKVSDAYYRKRYVNYAAGSLEGDMFVSDTGTAEIRGPGIQVIYAKGFSWDL